MCYSQYEKTFLVLPHGLNWPGGGLNTKTQKKNEPTVLYTAGVCGYIHFSKCIKNKSCYRTELNLSQQPTCLQPEDKKKDFSFCF